MPGPDDVLVLDVAEEDVVFAMDFARLLPAGATIQTVVSVAQVAVEPSDAAPLELGAPAWSGTKVQFAATPGAAAEARFEITVKVAGTVGGTRVGRGYIQVRKVIG